MGAATLLGRPAQGFFIPHRYAASVAPRAYPALAPLFDARAADFAAQLDALEAHAADLLAIAGPPPAPRFDQAWFPPLDAAIAYSLVRRLRPCRIVELGSGHSTRFLARAVQDQALATAITCIDPAPRAALHGLPVRWLATVVQKAPPEIFAGLASGDMLVVDSSHILMPGSDVDLVLGDILPRLAPGVVVHLHDIFLPDAYPEAWRWRGYNEQAAVAALLQGGGYTLLFASHYAATRLGARVAAGIPGRLGFDPAGLDGSLWLRKAHA